MAVGSVNPAGILGTAVQGLNKAYRDVAEVARDVADNGVDNLDRNLVKLTLAEVQAAANIAVVRATDDMADRLLDLIV